MKLVRVVLGCLLVSIALIACGAPTVPAVDLVTTASPLATPQVSLVSTPSITAVTPQPGTGAVIGRLTDIRTGQPAVKTILYLEQTINHDAPSMLYGPLSGQPRTDSTPDGSFTFNNVPPGEYILALYSPVDILYYQQGDGKAVLIQVKDGEVLDLGQVVTFIP